MWVAGCSKEEEPRVAATPPVNIFSLPQAGEAPFRNFPGEVTAQDNVRLGFEVAGRLLDFPVYDGKIVAKGDLIGLLDQSDFRAALDSAQASFHAASQEYARAKNLRQRNVIAQNELDRHREAFEVSEAALRTAQNSFDETRLLAPMKGRISHRFVRNFQTIQAREPIVLLQNIETLEVEVHVPENLMALVDRNTSAREAHALVEASVEFAAIQGERFPLELRSFATQADPSSRTFLVSFILHPPENRNILPGMTCTVSLRFRNKDGTPMAQPGIYEVPVRALLTFEGKSWVWRRDAQTGAVTKIPVEIANLSDDAVEIRSDALSAGDEIVSSGVRFLSEGMTVRKLETPES